MMGADLRAIGPEYVSLMQHPDLLRIDQDEECRPPYVIRRSSVTTGNPDPKEGEMPWRFIPDSAYTLFRHLSDNEFALAFINLSEADTQIFCELVDLGDVFTGEKIGKKSDYFNPKVPAHDMKLYLCRLVRSNG